MTDQAEAGRLAELTIALSLATDLVTGQPMEHGLRTCWLSLAVSRELGLDAATRSCVYYVALLRLVGCTADASESAVLVGGDEVAFNALMAPMLMAQPGEGTRFFLRHLGEDLPLHRRMGRIVRAVTDPGMDRRSLSGHCEVGARLATRLGLPAPVRDALAHAYERWDGKGLPAGLAGVEVPVAIRIVAAARDAELWARRGGWPAAAEVLAHRRGRAYDPAVVDALVDGERWLAEIDDDPGAAVLDAEPAPVLAVRAGELDRALAAVADFADLKSPWFRGHSTGVARLAAAAAGAAGMSAADATTLGRAARPRRRAGRHPRRDLGSPGPAQRRAVGAGPAALLPHRAGPAPVRPPRPLRRPRGTPPRAGRRLRVPPRRLRGSAHPRRPAAGRRRRLPRDDRGPAPPAGARPGGRGGAAARPG